MTSVYDQPIRYGSRRMAKSRVMTMLLKGPIASDPSPNRYHFACFGNRGHYRRSDGVCCHLEIALAAMRPWHRSRTWYLPFGDKDREAQKAPLDGVQERMGR